MSFITTKDGTNIFYKDWGPKDAQPIVFHHGWPLSSDDWDAQLMFFLNKGYRVVAHDRRGHGRSDQTDGGNEMDTYASDVDDLVTALNLTNAVHVGHSTGGGEVTRYVARHAKGRVAKAVLLDAVPPVMVKKDSNPGGTPIEAFDGYRAALAANRAQLYLDIPTGPFYGFNRPGAKVSEGLIRNWWRQGMMGSVKAALRMHQGLFRDRLHGGPPSNRCPGAGHSQRRRPDRPLCRIPHRSGQAPEERLAQDLQGLCRMDVPRRIQSSSMRICSPLFVARMLASMKRSSRPLSSNLSLLPLNE